MRYLCVLRNDCIPYQVNGASNVQWTPFISPSCDQGFWAYYPCKPTLALQTELSRNDQSKSGASVIELNMRMGL